MREETPTADASERTARASGLEQHTPGTGQVNDETNDRTTPV